ncbi:hypothetical protein ACA910_007237 [Epithemia clementina (nom. ined.)]
MTTQRGNNDGRQQRREDSEPGGGTDPLPSTHTAPASGTSRMSDRFFSTSSSQTSRGQQQRACKSPSTMSHSYMDVASSRHSGGSTSARVTISGSQEESTVLGANLFWYPEEKVNFDGDEGARSNREAGVKEVGSAANSVADEALTNTSSVGSAGLAELTGSSVRNLINLTDGDLFCQVITKQRDPDGGGQVAVVCGKPQALCNQQNHQQHQSNPARRGHGRFYQPMREPQGFFSDGRLDRVSYTREEVDQMRNRERSDMEEETRGLNQPSEEDEDVVDEVVKEVRLPEPQRQSSGITSRSAKEMPTEETSLRQAEAQPARTDQMSGRDGSDDEARTGLIFAMLNATGDKKFCRLGEELQRLMDDGYSIVATFETVRDMDNWAMAQERLGHGRHRPAAPKIGRSTTGAAVAFHGRAHPTEREAGALRSARRSSERSASSRPARAVVKGGGRDPGDGSSSSSSSSDPPVGGRKSGPVEDRTNRKKDKKSDHRKSPKGSKPSSDSDDESDGEVVRHGRQKTSRSHTKKHHRPKKGRHKDNSTSSDESSSYSSERGSESGSDTSDEDGDGADDTSSSDNSSEGSYSSNTRRRHQKQRDKKGRHKHRGSSRRRSKHQTRSVSSKNRSGGRKKSSRGDKSATESGKRDFLAEDRSAGKENMIYGLDNKNIGKLDAALCPACMHREDREELMTMGVNVTALPGVFDTGVSNEFDPTELATLMMATALGKRASAAYDTGWRKDSKVRMLKIKDERELQDFITIVEKAREPVFRQFQNRVRSLMHECGYHGQEIEEYLYRGGLPRLMMVSYDLYLRLLHTARQKSVEFGWDAGIAMALLKTHGEGLVAVRNYSSSYRRLVLDVYVYLQDKNKMEFMTPKVQEGVYRMHVDLFAQILGGGRS